MEPETPRLDAKATYWSTMGRFGVANLVGAVMVFVYLTLLSPDADRRVGDAEDVNVALISFLAFTGFAMASGYVVGMRLLRRSLGWLEEWRRPSPAERERTLQVPWHFGLLALSFWLFAVVVFAFVNYFVQDNSWELIARNSLGTALGGLTTAAAGFLLVEGTMRPVFAVALAGEPPRRERYLGIRPRLMLSWALGSGVPLVGIVVAVTRGRSRELVVPIGFLAGVALTVGWLIMYIAARSVADPLEHLRGAVRRVGEGNLDIAVAVDDGGEVGLLQAGVNQMAAGLREQQELRDLFGRHVGAQVARQALERTGLGGEQREASALFVDLIGSTGLAQERPVAEVVATLNALFEAVVTTVGAEGGWVNKFEGDGALCVFGAPGDQPDHAARALRAGRSLHQLLVTLRAQHDALDAGIGISSGVVVAGNVGAEHRYEYTVIGDPVNEAARLTDHAKGRPSRVLASKATVLAAGDEAAGWVRAGRYTIRGRTTPSVAYEPRR